MNEVDFDEQLDRALQRRAQADVPQSLARHVERTLAQERTRRPHRTWWKSAMAACLLLSLFLADRTRVHNRAPQQLAVRTRLTLSNELSRPSPPRMPTIVLPPPALQLAHTAQRVGRYSTVGARPSETTAPVNAAPTLDLVTDIQPSVLRAAEQTAACAQIPCSCSTMCPFSN